MAITPQFSGWEWRRDPRLAWAAGHNGSVVQKIAPGKKRLQVVAELFQVLLSPFLSIHQSQNLDHLQSFFLGPLDRLDRATPSRDDILHDGHRCPFREVVDSFDPEPPAMFFRLLADDERRHRPPFQKADQGYGGGDRVGSHGHPPHALHSFSGSPQALKKQFPDQIGPFWMQGYRPAVDVEVAFLPRG